MGAISMFYMFIGLFLNKEKAGPVQSPALLDADVAVHN